MLVEYPFISQQGGGLLLAMIATMGCANSTKFYVFENELNMTLVCADPGAVNESCRNDNGDTLDDLGHFVPRRVVRGPDRHGFLSVENVDIRACWKKGARELWMRWGEFCETLAHEFCHIDNKLTDAECARRYP